MTHPVIELQAADTMGDQLRHRRERLAERDAVQRAKNELVRWNQSRILASKRIEELTAVIEGSERAAAEIDVTRQRLEAQMKTIIAPREAEALQSELATLAARRSELDEAGLVAMEEQTRLDDELAGLAALEPELREAYLAADAALGAAVADIDSEIRRVESRLVELRANIEPRLLKRYDRLRGQHMVAAAALAGSRCDGCHLDLSAAEVEEARRASVPDGIADCPHCGRILVV